MLLWTRVHKYLFKNLFLHLTIWGLTYSYHFTHQPTVHKGSNVSTSFSSPIFFCIIHLFFDTSCPNGNKVISHYGVCECMCVCACLYVFVYMCLYVHRCVCRDVGMYVCVCMCVCGANTEPAKLVLYHQATSPASLWFWFAFLWWGVIFSCVYWSFVSCFWKHIYSTPLIFFCVCVWYWGLVSGPHTCYTC
jgi:hypothetical protein